MIIVLVSIRTFVGALTMTTQLVRYKQGKSNFEIMVKPGSMKKYREGKLDINSVVEADVIFKNQSKGDRANATDLA